MRVRRTSFVAVVAVVLPLTLAACGDDTEAADDLQTGIEDPFELRDGTIVGHGLTVDVPDDWVDYEETVGTDGTTYEWAVGQPESTSPFPAGLQLSAGIEGKGAQVETGLAEGPGRSPSSRRATSSSTKAR